MPENEFEKQVRSVTENFKLKPSAEVWQEVEKHLPEKEKKRRWILLFFLFTIIAGAGYFAITNSYVKDRGVAQTTQQNPGKPSLKESPVENSITRSQDIESENTTEEKQIPPSNNTTVSKNNKDHIITNRPGNIYSNPKQKNAESLSKAVANLTETEEKNVPQQNVSSGITHETKPAKLLPGNAADSKDVITENRMATFDSLQDTQKNTTLTSNDSSKQSTAAKPKNKPNNKKAWQLGVTTEYGVSDISERLFDLGTDKVYTSALIGSIPSLSVQNNFSLSRKISTGSMLSIGITARKEIAKKTFLTLGLGYSSNSNYLKIGKAYNRTAVFYNGNTDDPPSRVGSYYGATGTNTYRNTFKYISVPVNIERQINNSNKLPLLVQGGASFKYLYNSNALVYDTYNQVYYKGGKYINPLQAQVQAGFVADIPLSKKLSLQTGPLMQYHLTNMYRSPDYGKLHVLNYGLQARILLKK